MKKIIFLLFTVLIATTAWSQLHVAPKGNVFVTPQAYVYSDISLSVDKGYPSVDPNNVIPTTYPDAGDFTITSDADDSGSLIVKGATATGDITYKRHLHGGWQLISSPVAGINIEGFASDATNDLFKSENAGITYYSLSFYRNGRLPNRTHWSYYTKYANQYQINNNTLTAISLAGDFVVGKGYQVKRANAGTVTFTGTMDVDDAGTKYTIPLNIINEPALADDHLWSLVGNPYPSFLPANTAAQAENVLGQNIAKMDSSYSYIMIWSESADEYVIINNAPAVGDPAAEPYFIAPGQGFLVDPRFNNTDFVVLENLQQVQTQADATFYRSEPVGQIGVKISDGTEDKLAALMYMSNATKDLDVTYDAASYIQDADNPDLAIGTHLVENSNGLSFDKQCLPDVNELLEISLNVSARANKTITFTAEKYFLEPGLKVYLEDRLTNTFTDISTTSYDVTLTQDISGIGRFYLYTTQGTLSVDDTTLVEKAINMYKTDNTNLRITGLQDTGKANVFMYSVTGKQVLTTSFEMQNINDIALPRNLSTGVYIVQLVANNKKQSKKIIIE